MVIFFNKEVQPPWAGKPSIYSYIREQGESLDGSLPDDEEFWAGSKLRWVAGGLDGAFGHHAAPDSKTDGVRELVDLMARHSRKPKHLTRKAIYEKLVETDLIGKIDVVLDEVRRHPGMQTCSLFHEARWLAENGAHRNVVKFGIALLGLFRNEELKELLLTLGKHDEFTLYALVAIQNGMEESNEVLFELAKCVHGWGKIHIVERLEPISQEIKDWLLRHGCQNNVMNEYLACICARNGGLQEALSSDQIDEELFEGATDIIQALLYGGPAEDIDDYEHAPQVISNYIRIAEERCTTLKHLSVLMDIRSFLNQDDDVWNKRETMGWTGQLRSDNLKACQAIIAHSKWGSIVIDAVNSSDSLDHHYGVDCAEKLGIDIWDILYTQLAVNPIQHSHYFQLMKTDELSRMLKLVQFAEEQLPLEQIASGPRDEMGFGEEFAAHQCLGCILQSLDRYEGVGKELVITGLYSPVVSNRNMALNTLEAWKDTSWGDQLIKAVVQLAEIEPEDSVKERIQKLREVKGI